MESRTVSKIRRLKGELRLPGDKSISHRAIILGSIAEGGSRITNFCTGDDTFRTIQAFRTLGVTIEGGEGEYTVWGRGLNSLLEPKNVIDAGNSGTTARLLTGLLSGHHFLSVITGDESLRTRPMNRITSPLRTMGARIDGRDNGNYVPLVIRGGELSSLQYEMQVASAQVKSALLLAGLYASGTTQVREPAATRDHTERMLEAMGAVLEREANTVRIQGFPRLDPFTLLVPGDVSSAAFFIVAATIVPDSEILIRDVGCNPTRTGVVEILQKMGANLEIMQRSAEGGEPKADLIVRHARLKAVDIGGPIIPKAIDELPILAIAAAHAEGTTTIQDASELRVKETDRIHAMVTGLRRFGVEVDEFSDGMAITGQEKLKGAVVSSFNDHRIAMAFIVAGLAAAGNTTIDGTDAIGISYPEFIDSLTSLVE